MKRTDNILIISFLAILLITGLNTHPTKKELIFKVKSQVLEYCKNNIDHLYKVDPEKVKHPSFFPIIDVSYQINHKILGDPAEVIINDYFIFQTVQSEDLDYPNLIFLFGDLMNDDELEKSIVKDIENYRLIDHGISDLPIK